MARLFVIPVMQIAIKDLAREDCNSENADDLMIGTDRRIIDANDTECNGENESEDTQHCRDALENPVEFE